MQCLAAPLSKLLSMMTASAMNGAMSRRSEVIHEPWLAYPGTFRKSPVIYRDDRTDTRAGAVLRQINRWRRNEGFLETS